MWRQTSLTSSEDTNLGLPAEEHVNFIYSSRSEFSICRSFTFSRSTNLRMRFFFFDFWVTRSPLKHIHVYTDTYIYTHARTSSLRTRLIVTLRNVHSLNLLVESFVYILKLNRSLSFCVVKFFHEHFCFTFSYDVFRLFWPPEMTVY